MPDPRRTSKRLGRKVRERLTDAIDLLDDLVEDSEPEALSLAERAEARALRERLLLALADASGGAPALFALPTPLREVTG